MLPLLVPEPCKAGLVAADLSSAVAVVRCVVRSVQAIATSCPTVYF